MKRLLAASLTAVLSVGLLVAPPAAALGGAATGSVTIVGSDIDEFSTACPLPGTSILYAIVAHAYDDEWNIVVPDTTGWYIETVYRGTRTKMATTKITASIVDSDGTQTKVPGFQFANPDHLPYRLVHSKGVGKLFTPADRWYGGPTQQSPRPRTSPSIPDTNGWKSATLTPAAARMRKVTIANPDGRTLVAEVKVGADWWDVAEVNLRSGVTSQTVSLDLMGSSPVRFKNGGSYQFRLTLRESVNYREVSKVINVKVTRGKQKVKASASRLRRGATTLKVTSTQAVPAQVTLQRKVGKKWRSSWSWTTQDARVKDKVELDKGTYRVVVTAKDGLATKATSKAFKVK